MGEQSLIEKLHRIATEMGEFDWRRPVILEATAALEVKVCEAYPNALAEALGAPPQSTVSGELSPSGVVDSSPFQSPMFTDPTERGVRKIGSPPTMATCGLCGFEGPKRTTNCTECSERW